MFALMNFFSFSAYFVAFTSWGYLVGGKSGRPSWRPAIGIAACSITATLCFECGLSIATYGRMIFGVGAAGALLWSIRRREIPVRLPLSEATIPLVAVVLLIAPAILGGSQFALFQGNINDQFNYLASAVVRTTEGHKAIAAATPTDFLRFSLLSIAHTMGSARPAVVDLYAAFEGLSAGNLHRSQYGFLCAILLGTFFAVSGCVQSLALGSRRGAQLIALAYVVGFWGQLQLDLNSWSWAAATPLAAVVVAMASGIACEATGGFPNIFSWRDRAAFGLCGSGILYLYPEMFAFLAPAISISWVGLLLAGRVSRGKNADLAWGGLLIAVFLVPKIGSLAGFLVHQISFSSHADFSPLDWMWQAIVGGDLSGVGPLGTCLRWLAGGAGLGWFLTPESRWAAILLAVGALGAALWQLKVEREIAPAILMVLGVALLMAAEVALCVALGHRWIGAKALSYASVLMIPLLLSPVAAGRLSLCRVPAFVLLSLQIVLGILRLIGARDPDGIHYHMATYPAVMDPALKTARRWSVGEGPQFLLGSRNVKIDVPDVWLETYAAICVQSQGLAYRKGLPVYVYLGISKDSYGTQQPSDSFDAIVYMDYDREHARAALGFARRGGDVYPAQSEASIFQILTLGGLETRNGMLAWRLSAGGAASTARVKVESPSAVSAVLELGLIAPKSTGRALKLTIQTETSGPLAIAVAGYGMEVIEGLQVPIQLARGANEILLTLVQTNKGAAKSDEVTFVNPRVIPVLKSQVRR